MLKTQTQATAVLMESMCLHGNEMKFKRVMRDNVNVVKVETTAVAATEGTKEEECTIFHSKPACWSQQLPRDESSEPELFLGMNSGINFNNYDEIPVEATGENVPQPATLFSELKLHQWVNENIKLSGYGRSTPVQKYSIPALMDNRDLMSCAQTGSGKTAAFLVPLINHILQNGPEAVYREAPWGNGRKKQFPCALVLSPTRELSLQIYNECRKFGYRTPITLAILYGGRENYKQQISKLGLGCHILIDVMEQGYVGLTGCRYLVIDEADRMLDMGFEPQIRQIVELSTMPEKRYRVTAMFSATFPKEIQILAQDFLVPNYVFLAVGRVGSTSANIIQKVVGVEDKEKLCCLMDLLDAGGNETLTVVFVETKRGASDLQNYLDRKNYGVVAIHGDGLVVLTSQCILGIGRAGNIGLTTTFFNDKNTRLANDLIKLMIEANQEIPEFLSTVSNDASRYGQANLRGRGSRAESSRNGFRPKPTQNKDCDRLLCDVSLVPVKRVSLDRPETLSNFCKGSPIYAHKVILSSTSPYFCATFGTSNMIELKASTVELHDMDEEALRQLIDFIYTGQLTINSNLSHALLTTASMLQLNSVKDACAKYGLKFTEKANV
ncbi:unnamed protein product, partial [Mesorhabditis belari]|uniref:RNA helicase n=1 Tax=Mesorhabditis belari TaxID=2138241 RepID=A0AAF3EYA0_9BILA